MHVLLVNHHVSPPGGIGGSRHFSLARELVRRGHRVTIVAASFRHMTRSETLAPGEERKWETAEGVEFLWLRTPPYSGNTVARVRNMLTFAWKVSRLRPGDLAPGAGGGPDLVIGSSPHPFAAFAAERLARSLGVPFVLEVRDLWPQTLIDLGRLSPRHPLILLMGWLERHVYRQAVRIISLLPLAAEHMAAKGADPGRVEWLPNGVDFSLVPEQDPVERSWFTVLYAGSHGLANALDTVLDAAQIIRRRGLDSKIRFRFVGDGPAKRALEERAAREGLGHFVTFEPAVPKDQIFGVMQEADCFVMTLLDSPLYRWGISPNKIYDYLASGRPIVFGSSCPYAPIDEAGAGYTIQPADPEAMARAIVALYETPLAERIAMGRRGRAYARQYHSFARLGARLEEILLECLPAGDQAREGAGVVS